MPSMLPPIVTRHYICPEYVILASITGPSSTTPYAATAPPVSYPQMVAQGAPPSYAESLSHPVVPTVPVHPQFAPYVTTAAAASAAQLQNYKVCK